MAQKFVVNEKVVKLRELLKQSFTVFYKNVLTALQIKLRQKGEGQCPGAPPPLTMPLLLCVLVVQGSSYKSKLKSCYPFKTKQ